MATTQSVWITRDVVTVRHLRGLLKALEEAQALDYAGVRIMTVTDDRAVEVPRQLIETVGGVEVDLKGDPVITYDNLPAQGII